MTTSRSAFVKLELVGDTKTQLEAVKSTIYNLNLPSTALSIPANDSVHWKVTDDLLYSEAKRSYDNVINAFLASPRVYKLDAMRRKREHSNFNEQIPEEQKPKSKHYKRKRRKKDTEDGKIDEEESFIDPFVMGQYDQVWKEKVSLLEKLTPREDLDGYEYRENYDEQQFRLSLQQDFQERLMYEVRRRAEEPTEEEQVEDVLFDIVKRIVKKQNNLLRQDRMQAQLSMKDSVNPVITGRKMKRLLNIESQDGEVSAMVSDAPYVDVLITQASFIVPKTIPSQVIAQHSEEKRLLEALHKKEEEDREAQRRLPLSTKLRSAVLRAKEDLSGSVRQMLRDVLDKTFVLPTRPIRTKCVELVTQASHGIIGLCKDPQVVVDTLADYVMDSYDRISDSLLNSEESDSKKNKKEVDAALEEIKEEAIERVQAAQGDGESLMSDGSASILPVGSITVDFPDSVLVKLVVNIEPPPAYVFRPKKTLKKEMKKWKRKTLTSLEEKGEKFRAVLNKLLSKAVEDNEEKDAVVFPSLVKAIERDPNYHALVHTKDIVGDENYSGYLRPEHMFVYEQEVLHNIYPCTLILILLLTFLLNFHFIGPRRRRRCHLCLRFFRATSV
ncbi:hypothetical protein EON65_11270 [archaeon]|nr:MAG: hypothetical protein EON65_11270 [archaeon]